MESDLNELFAENIVYIYEHPDLLVAHIPGHQLKLWIEEGDLNRLDYETNVPFQLFLFAVARYFPAGLRYAPRMSHLIFRLFFDYQAFLALEAAARRGFFPVLKIPVFNFPDYPCYKKQIESWAGEFMVRFGECRYLPFQAEKEIRRILAGNFYD